MDWKSRLLGISLAGGTIVACASSSPGISGGPCNANPDPCCPIGDGKVQNPLLCNDASVVDAGTPVADGGADAG
jgi:hypothetical protein